MTNSISTTVVEVKKNIHDSYNGLMTANVKTNKFNVMLTHKAKLFLKFDN